MPKTLSGWPATGLCLAAVCLATTKGLGALLGAVVFAPVVYALVRLRANAPAATSTSGLVAAALGRRAGAFTGALQLLGYALVAVAAAQGLSLITVLEIAGDPEQIGTWPWPLAAGSAVAVAALLVRILRDRVLAAVAGLLAVTGVLIFFYLGLAVAARFLTGTEPVLAPQAQDPPSDFGVFAALAQLAVAVTAFEIGTVRTHRLRSIGAPTGLAISTVALVATLVWYATDLGGRGAGDVIAEDFGVIVTELYGPAGNAWLVVASVSLSMATLLALTWGATAVLGRIAGGLPALAVFVAASAIVAVVLSLLGRTSLSVGELVLCALYVVILIASWRLPGDDLVSWWSRIVTPVGLLAIVLAPVLAHSDSVSFQPILVAVGLVATAAVVSLVGTRSRSG